MVLYHPDAGYWTFEDGGAASTRRQRPGYARVSRHPPAAFARRCPPPAHGARMFCATPAPRRRPPVETVLSAPPIPPRPFPDPRARVLHLRDLNRRLIGTVEPPSHA